MGNCVGTIDWDGSQDDDTVKRHLKAIMYKYGLSEAHPNMGRYTPGKTHFHVEISGFNIWWEGGSDECEEIIRDFLEESTKFLRENAQNTQNPRNVSTCYQFLPC